jgi:uncharacterized protein (TIGR03437 family)
MLQNMDGTLNSTNNPADPGRVVIAYLTGQGALDNPVPTGAAAPASPLSRAKATASATIGGRPATVQFLGLAPSFVGLAQANVLVPDLAPGDYPLVITVGGVASNAPLVSVK